MLKSNSDTEKCCCAEASSSVDETDPKSITTFSCLLHCPSSRRRNLKFLSDWRLEKMLEKYLLTCEELQNGGFPFDFHRFHGCAFIFKPEDPQQQKLAALNPDAQEFIPGQCQIFVHPRNYKPPLLRKCKRCSYSFPVDNETGEYLLVEECVYHPGKLRRKIWECCGAARELSRGCATAKRHVWTGVGPGCNGPLDGFVQTRPLCLIPSDSAFGVFALDCEMSFTKKGMELIKISVAKLDGAIIYDHFVKPSEVVIDYGTEIHGITEEEVVKATKTLIDVQNDLLQFIHAESILLGHGLENDLLVLRLIHKRIIDTSYLFPHEKGFPYRYSLKTLAKSLLKMEIQVAKHDSVEDARVAMDVMLCKLEEDLHKNVYV